MITFKVTTHNGAPLAQPLLAEFDETGGTLGRAPTNQLVLPDPERLISRVHARIAYREGGYVIIDQGGNAIHLNERPVGKGNSARLANGDELRIGAYTLQVSLVASGREDKALARASAAPAAAPRPATASSAQQSVDDPLALFGGAGGGDPFGGLISGSSSAVEEANRVPPAGNAPSRRDPFAAPPAGAPKSTANVIPADFDPFADPFARNPAAPEAFGSVKLPDDLDLGLNAQSASGQGIDALFGLSGSDKHDPFSGGALGEPSLKPDAHSRVDPLAALGGAAPVVPAAAASDHVPEVNASFTPPRAMFDQSMPAPQPPQAARDAPTDDPLLAMFGGDSERSAKMPPGADLLGLESAPPTGEPKGSDTMTSIPATATWVPISQRGAKHAQRLRVPTAESPQAQPAAHPEGEQALLAALLAGLGMPGLVLPEGLTPEIMERIGSLLREATQGTLDLLLARSVTKREVRADVTMMAGRDNNPLKFSPDVGDALTHLLAPRGRGFMPPLEAMQDAYVDLRSHQFGFMAGMRAALAGVLERFDPENLEQRLKQHSVLDNLLSMSRKAKMWDLFAEMYGQISQEAEEDFHALFGKEFLRAYEEQIARLEQGKSP